MSAYLYGGLGVVILILGVATWGQSKRIDVLNTQNAGLRADLSTATNANEAQKQTITELQTANADWARKATVREGEYKAVLLDLSKANAARNAAQDAMRAKESKDRASRECQMVLSEDIAKSCPDIAADMLQRAK